MQDGMVTIRKTARKRRTIVMLTSSSHTIAPRFTEKRPQNRSFSSFFTHFLHFSYALAPNISHKCQSMYGNAFAKLSKIQKSGYIFFNIIFLKVKMDMLFMSFFKKKDRILKLFFPAHFHFTGLGLKIRYKIII